MPAFRISLLRIDRDESPTVMVSWRLTFSHSIGHSSRAKAREILEDYEAQTVESVGYGIEGDPLVNLGRIVLDDLQVAQLRKAGWRAVAVPGGPTR